MSRIPPDHITEDIFSRIEDETEFRREIMEQYRYALRGSYLSPRFSKQSDSNQSNLHDAYQAWRWDMNRLPDSMDSNSSEPNHFKQCGHLAFWLRRFPPVVDFWDRQPGGVIQNQGVKEFREAMFNYSAEYLAFELGLRICRFFSEYGEIDKVAIPDPSPDYFKAVCYFLKYKQVSPHALVIIYESLFAPRENKEK